MVVGTPHLYVVVGTPHLYVVVGTPHLYAVVGTPHLYVVVATPHLYAVVATPHLYVMVDSVDPSPVHGGGPPTCVVYAALLRVAAANTCTYVCVYVRTCVSRVKQLMKVGPL